MSLSDELAALVEKATSRDLRRFHARTLTDALYENRDVLLAALRLAEAATTHDGDNHTHTGSCLRGKFVSPPDCGRCATRDAYQDAIHAYRAALAQGGQK